MSRKSSLPFALLVAGFATLFISLTFEPPAFAEPDAPFGEPGAAAGQPQFQPNQDGVEVMGRGPIHEAFAGPVVANPAPGIVIPRQPPEPVEEVPPDQAPTGTNVAWIPGYWAWDDERTDFLWVSGFYRDIPEGREWIPGYWTQSTEGEGFQWVSGYWGGLEAQVAVQPDGLGTAPDLTEEYLPEPPDSLEAGPSTQPPEPDQVWIPGVWSWQETRYAWRPGYWVPPQNDFMWIPAQYCWTPRGYRFVNGYWDYPVTRRGLLFAPVYFTQPVYAQQGFSYSPAVSVDLSLLTDSLFVRPSYCHYYFGDYYGDNYARAGVVPWFAYHNRRGGYDPIYTYYRHQHRDRGWDTQMRAQYQNRREHADARPPRLYVRGAVGGRDRNSIVKPLAFFAGAGGNRNGLRLQRINDQQRRQMITAARDVRRFTQQRVSLETRGRAGDRDRVPGRVVRPEDRRPEDRRPGDRRPGDTRPDIPGRQPGRADPAPRLRSPIAARPAQPETGRQPQPGTVRAAPARPKEPRPDPKILPNPRRTGDRPDTRNPLVQPLRPGDGKLPPRTVDPLGRTPRVPTTPPVTTQPNPPKIDPGRPGLTPTPPRTPTIPPTQPPKQTPRAGPDPIPPRAPPRTPQPPREPPTVKPPTTPPRETPRAGPDPIPPRAPPRTPQPPRDPPTVKPPTTPPKLAPQPPNVPPKANPLPTPPKLAPQPPKAPPQPPRTQPQPPRSIPQPPVQPQPPKLAPPVRPQPPRAAPQPPKAPPQPPRVAPQPPPKAPPQPPPKQPDKEDPKKKP